MLLLPVAGCTSCSLFREFVLLSGHVYGRDVAQRWLMGWKITPVTVLSSSSRSLSICVVALLSVASRALSHATAQGYSHTRSPEQDRPVRGNDQGGAALVVLSGVLRPPGPSVAGDCFRGRYVQCSRRDRNAKTVIKRPPRQRLPGVAFASVRTVSRSLVFASPKPSCCRP